jgi:hypothetical protein
MQFYVVDAEAEYRADWVWHGKGLERHLGVSPGIVAVGTIGYTSLPVRLEIWDEEPRRDLESWDHVVEATLDVASGRLGLHDVGGPGDLSPIEIAPGTYRVRSAGRASTAPTRWRAATRTALARTAARRRGPEAVAPLGSGTPEPAAYRGWSGRSRSGSPRPPDGNELARLARAGASVSRCRRWALGALEPARSRWHASARGARARGGRKTIRA